MEQEKINLTDKKNYVNDKVLLLEVEIDSDVFVLVCIFDNIEPYQLNYITELHNFSKPGSTNFFKT